MSREELENEILLLEELAKRQADDPWLSYVPHEKQKEFIGYILNGVGTEAWMICANRTGKTDGASYMGAGLARFGRQLPGWDGCGPDGPTKGWVISTTGGASRTVVQPKYFDNGIGATGNNKPFIPAREIRDFNKNEQILYLKNGSTIEFKSAEAKTISLAGAGLDWVHVDEELPKPKYDELTIRIEGGRRLLVFGACTLLPPEGQVGGVSWMFEAMIKPFMNTPSACNYKLFSASIYDNPHLLAEEVARLESKYPLGSVERRIRLDGEWLPGLQGSRAYTSFDARVHVRPQADHFSPRRPICWTWDFNVEPMVSLIGQRDGRIFRVFHELILDQGDLDVMVQYFHEKMPLHHGEVWVYGDATGRNRHAAAPGGRSEFQIIMNLMRTYGSPVRLKVPEVNPLVTDRINAVNIAHRNEQGEHCIEIDPSCTELISDLEGVLRDNRGGIKKVSNRNDPYFRRTHTSDAFGYWVAYEAPVRLTNLAQRLTRALKKPTYAFGRR